jgi:hypothetical protein
VSGALGDGRLATLAVGLALGLAGGVACLACWAWWRHYRPGAPAPVAGLALAAAGAAGIAATATTRPAGTLLPGLAVLALAGAALSRARRARPATRPLALAAAGCLWLAGAVLTGWSLAADGGAAVGVWVAVAICAVGALLDDADRRRAGQGLAPALLAVTAAGIYATVPDVEAAEVVVAAALPMALLGWPFPLAWARPARPPPSLGTPGALATAGLLVWTVAAGGSGRSGSVVGGCACLGLLALEPLAHRLAPRRSPAASAVPTGPGWRLGWLALAVQVVLVAVAARVVGRPSSAAGALLPALLEIVVIVALALLLERRRAIRDRSPRRRDEIPSG